MSDRQFTIGIVAPAGRMDENAAERVATLAARECRGRAVLKFHPQCFEKWGHFAGTDQSRANAFLEYANDAAIDAVWFARGGYGSVRIVEDVVKRLGEAARRKAYVGYSDLGSLMAALYAKGCSRVSHGPMPADILRADGESAVIRSLRYLADGDQSSVEPTARTGEKCLAFNLTILSRLIGTAYFPKLSGHVLMIEDVSEYMYNIDRTLAHLTSIPAVREAKGIRLGRVSLIPPNEPDFGQTEVEVVQHWCGVAGIPFLGRADIGHDAANKIVPFGGVTVA